ncbi:MscL family protein [Candidatus Pacearchaeota archaeon]|nr:MscL family protein [Candidatus Pacearchaeota archaeon]
MIQKVHGFAKEFFEFIKEYKVVGLAVGIVMGLATTALVKSLVDNIIMPLLTPFIPGGAWREAALSFGPWVIKIGAFLGELLNFIVIALAIFFIAKVIIREEKVSKK